MVTKFTGFLLLVVGLITILYSAYSVYTVFTKKNEPIALFNFTGLSYNFSQLAQGSQSQEGLKLPASEIEVLSPDKINQPLNIIFHLMFMGFLVNIGFKISSLGVMLIRPIKVSLKPDLSIEKNLLTSETKDKV